MEKEKQEKRLAQLQQRLEKAIQDKEKAEKLIQDLNHQIEAVEVFSFKTVLKTANMSFSEALEFIKKNPRQIPELGMEESHNDNVI